MSGRLWTPEEVRALGVRTELVTAGSVLGLSRNVSYELAARGEFPVPVLRLGARWVVPVAPLLGLLGLTPDDSKAGPASPAAATTDAPVGGPPNAQRPTPLRRVGSTTP